MTWNLLAAVLSPATGEKVNALPFILAGVGVVALVAFVVLTVLQKKNSDQDPKD